MHDVTTGAGGPRRGGCRRGQRGMVTVEVALASIGLAVLVGGGFTVAHAGFRMVECQVAANEIARQQARGDAAAVRRATADAPEGASVAVRTVDGRAEVEVGWRAAWGPVVWPVAARAAVIEEPGP
ncbi:hypothetical protein [Propioniciclava soli]|uniref:Pilus assembly protein TadE n=1 Tax=Propioniciclava soli TaxID=2775081 RepID=A0ABZ3C8Z8_9ACTN|nr:hypothetical protein [Propioniciclava soli]